MKHFLTVTAPEQKPVKYTLKGKKITVGRISANAITIDIPEISSRHLELHAGDDGNYRIVDVGSTNGTTLNDEKLSEHILADGDELVLGLVVKASYAAVADEAAATPAAQPAVPLQPQVVQQNPAPATPTVVLKKPAAPAASGQPAKPRLNAPAAAAAAAQPAAATPAAPAAPAEPAAPDLKIRKMAPPSTADEETEEEEEEIPVATAIPEEETETPEPQAPQAPKLSVPPPPGSGKTGGGPKKLNFG